MRDLAASINRIATLSPRGRIDRDAVAAEIARLMRLWSGAAEPGDDLAGLLSPERQAELDPFDRVQLANVVATCRRSCSLSEAGRSLLAASRIRRSSVTDADRLRKYLARFGLGWGDLVQ